MSAELASLISKLAEHRLFIDTLTSATAFLIGLLALRLGRRALRDERWIGYFGWGFVIFGIQYAAPTLLGIGRHLGWPLESLRWLEDVVSLLGSAVNNVLFLAAAIALLKLEWRPSSRYWAVASILGLLSAAMDWWRWLEPWHRSLDGVFSAVAVGALGIAFLGNASPRRRPWFLGLASVGAGLYSLLRLAIVAVPVIADNSPGFGELVQQALSATGSIRTVTFALDTFLIALALVLNLSVAFGGFSLVLRALVIIAPREEHEILEQVSRGDLEYFSGRGIVRAICQSLSADRAAVCIRLPGRTSRMLRWQWPMAADDEVELPSADDRREGTALAQGQRVVDRNRKSEKDGAGKPVRSSLIVEPLLHHGTVTGCLTVEWNRQRGFTNTAMQQTSRLAETLGPAVEARRMLAALLYWGEKRQESQIETHPPGYRNLALILARLVHETLSPLSVGLELDVGFGGVWAVVGDADAVTGLRVDLPTEGLRAEVERCGGTIPGRTQTIELKYSDAMIGRLRLLWPRLQVGGSLSRTCAAVYCDEQHLQVFGPLIVSAVLRSVDTAFFVGLGDLQVKFLEARQVEQWFAAIDSEVRKLGPVWVLATLGDGRIFGDGPHDVTRQLAGLGEGTGAIWNQRLPEPQQGAAQVVLLRLPKSQAQLWLGASNRDLGPELAPGWPWKGFLERLATTADAALFDLSNEAELHRVKREVRQIGGLVRATADSGTFIHEMRNIARNFSFAAQSLGEAKRRGELSASIDIEADIDAMVRSADRLHGLADAVLRPRESDSNQETVLEDLVKEIEDLFAPVLRAHQIEFRSHVPADLRTSVPAYVLHTALKTLVSNSVDALVSGGIIRIEAESTGSVLRVAVNDDGPGIQLESPQSVFHLGRTTKGTTGVGLFLVRNLLESVRARIQLTNWRSGQTTFIIELPACHGKE